MITQDPSTFQKRINTFWNENNKNSFMQINNRLDACAKNIDKLRRKALETISALFKSTPQPEFIPILTEQSEILHGLVREVRKIEENLSDAFLLKEEAAKTAEASKGTKLAGDYYFFVKRLNDLFTDVNNVYKNSLYPFLQVVQNAQSGWNPAGIVCKVCDYYNWRQRPNPKNEIFLAFPS